MAFDSGQFGSGLGGFLGGMFGDSGQSLKMGDAPVTVSGVRPYSPRPVRETSPPSCCARSWAP